MGPGETLIPLAGIFFIFGIPLAAILTGHQRKMAELMAQQRPQNTLETQRVLEELAYLRDKVNQQALALDNLKTLSLGNQSNRQTNVSPTIESPPQNQSLQS